MPGFYTELARDPDYLNIPERIDEEELDRRVSALRLGDMSQVNRISVMLMRLALSLVANFAHPRRTPDLIGVAMLTLVESVRSASTRLNDNNIVAFVSTHINHRLKDAIAKDHVVCIPPRTLRSFRQQGITAFVPLSTSYLHLEGVARREEASLEFRDMIEKMVKDDRERLLVDMRIQRHAIEVIAEQMGVSVSLIHKLKSDMRKRFIALDVD